MEGILYCIIDKTRMIRITLGKSRIGYRCFSNLSFTRQELNINNNINNNNNTTNNDSIIIDNIKLPTVELINNSIANNTGLKGLFSDSTLKDLHNGQSMNLESLKEALSDSYYKNYIDSFKSQHKDASNNPIIGQYKNLLEKCSINYDNNSYIFDLSSNIYNYYYFTSILKSRSGNLIKPNANALLETNKISINNIPTSPKFLSLIKSSFNSVEEFLTLLNDSILSIKGNGNTWVTYNYVANSKTYENFKKLTIVNTYNNGSPYDLLSNRIQTGEEFINRKNKSINQDNNSIRSDKHTIPTIKEAQKVNNFKFNSHPLFAIPSNPSYYLRDYGVYGKQEYIKNVLASIDWDIVQSRADSN